MTAGYLEKDVCYSTLTGATDAYFGVFPQTQSYNMATFFQKQAGVWKFVRYDISATGVWSLRYTVGVPAPVFPTCTVEENFLDGLSVGWSIALLMVVAWGFTMIKRQAR